MQFEWNEAKRRSNFRRHGIDFADVEEIFDCEILTLLDDRFAYGEIRFFTLGLLNGRVVAVSHTETDEVVRIISARKARKDEEITYFEEFKN